MYTNFILTHKTKSKKYTEYMLFMKNLDLNQILQNEKNKFLDEKHLDW